MARFTTLLGIALILVSVSVTVSAAPWHQQSINVESKIGTDRSIQSLDVMYPLSHTDHSLTFTDLRGRIDDDQSVELNLGLAHRAVMTDPLGLSDEAVIGYYGFADRLESEFDNVFYQATAGAEYFTKDYSLRVNGYLPENKTADAGSFTRLVQTGTQIYFQTRVNKEKPLPGFDLELGRTVRYDWGQLYGRASYFHFDDENAAKVAGSRLRAGVQLPGSTVWNALPSGSQLTLGAEWQTDDIRDEQTFGVFRVSMPFGSEVSGVRRQVSANNEPAPLPDRQTAQTAHPPNRSTGDSRLSAWQQDRLTERIERDVDIVTGRTEETTVADTSSPVLATTGETIGALAVAESGAGGSGAMGDPAALTAAVNTAGTDGAVLISDASGTFTITSSGIDIPAGQVVAGGHRGLVLRSPDGALATRLTIGSDTPVLKGTNSGGAVFRTTAGADRQVFKGLKLVGQGNFAPLKLSGGRAKVRNLVIEADGSGTSRGIDLNAVDGPVTLRDVTLGAKDEAIEYSSLSGGNLILRNIHVTRSGSGGAITLNGSGKSNMENVRIEEGGAGGSGGILNALTGGLTGDSITVDGGFFVGIQLGETGGHRTNLNDLTVQGGVTGAGVRIRNSDTVTLTNTSIQGAPFGLVVDMPDNDVRNLSLDVTATATTTPLSINDSRAVDGVEGTIKHDRTSNPCSITAMPDIRNSSLLLKNPGERADVLSNSVDACR